MFDAVSNETIGNATRPTFEDARECLNFALAAVWVMLPSWEAE